MAFLPICQRPIPRTGTTTTNADASQPPIMYAITTENMSISGLLTAVLITIINAICTLLTSVVRRVTRDADENLSIFSKL